MTGIRGFTSTQTHAILSTINNLKRSRKDKEINLYDAFKLPIIETIETLELDTETNCLYAIGLFVDPSTLKQAESEGRPYLEIVHL